MSEQQISKNAIILIDTDEISELKVEDGIDISYVGGHYLAGGDLAIEEAFFRRWRSKEGILYRSSD